jgi:hypothetical protein
LQQNQLEQEEECLINKLMKRLEQLKREKQILANEVRHQPALISTPYTHTLLQQRLTVPCCCCCLLAGGAGGGVPDQHPPEEAGQGACETTTGGSLCSSSSYWRPPSSSRVSNTPAIN